MSKQSSVVQVARAAADFGDAADAVDRAAAEHLGVNRTDLRILAAVRLGGPVSAGALAGAVDLSPPATTEAVQRLVARGLLTRDVDPDDRRRALIALVPATRNALDRLYGPVRAEGHALLGRYSEDELALLADFLDRGRRLQLDAAERIRREGQALP
ncbi:MarR family winged helix-turn-helix transcriptional regulator [Pseudonocardia broussonetiae]|uniref:Winged helix-turn-helix transcriptional regulator n=1 Tax=Pseudonocardia broussonetiae TaxID=2736640 RepID=A0A6M6JT33_9PSEU|nr:MarR family winged helix-turn-helix transcriptional regulator [Pseudonocardia broussonetiae]QJY50246.1 winged helix-turn-helix transcriptional regulator [Pseudonocardia broussonetiae]